MKRKTFVKKMNALSLACAKSLGKTGRYPYREIADNCKNNPRGQEEVIVRGGYSNMWETGVIKDLRECLGR